MKRWWLVVGVTMSGFWLTQACGGGKKSGSNTGSSTASGGAGSGGASGGTAGNAGNGGTAASGAGAAGGTGGASSVNGGTGGTTGTGGASGGSAGQGGDNPGPVCGQFGDDCSAAEDCCSSICSPTTDTCGRNTLECNEAGSACASNTDCCSANCDGGECSSDPCIDDGDDCSGGGVCCSGSCSNDSCDDVNGGDYTCKSAGNSCSDGSECCSRLCKDGHCDIGSSYCTQLGDICNTNADCCSGSCNIDDGASVGYCIELDTGPNRCADGFAGMVCDGDCSQCCSRACGPGPAGVVICQPPSGCRPAGELCQRDTDCCGGDDEAGLPGSNSSNSFCDREDPNDVFGRCVSQACTPQGDVCQLNGGLCSESTQLPSNCCPTNANPSNPNWQRGECEFDSLGIPRCNGFSDDYCVEEGGSCSHSGDCCENRPCVPDPNDGGRLKCGENECVEAEQGCTTNADCCDGLTCFIAAGEVFGTCGGTPPGTTTTTTTGTGGTSGTGGMPGTGGSGGTTETCQAYGQTCDTSADCCFPELDVECLETTEGITRCLIQG